MSMTQKLNLGTVMGMLVSKGTFHASNLFISDTVSVAYFILRSVGS